MKIFDSAWKWAGGKISAATQRDKTGFFVDWAQGGQSTLAGVRVSNDSALQLSTVFACIKSISEDVGKLPFKLYKSRQPRGKDALTKHWVYSLLHDAPNPEMTAMTFRQVLTAHALSWGNGFAEIERGYDGTPKYLWPLKPNRVRVFRLEDARIWYEITTEDGQTAWLRDDNVFHVPGLGFDGLVGYNVIRYARECLGAAIATQKQAATFFGNGIRAGGMLKHPDVLGDKARDNLRRAFSQYQGPDNAHRMMIIEEGMEFTQTTIPPEEAQFLETRQFSVPEICRWFRFPPNKAGDTTRAQGWSTLEQTNTDYVVDTLMPWLVRWEQEVGRKLLTPREQRTRVFARHVVQGLLRGDIKTRKDYYIAGRNWGFLSADDIRELEDMNPLPDGKGNIYLQPLNMIEAGTEPEKVVVPTVPPIEKQDPEAVARQLIEDSLQQVRRDAKVQHDETLAAIEVGHNELKVDFEGFNVALEHVEAGVAGIAATHKDEIEQWKTEYGEQKSELKRQSDKVAALIAENSDQSANLLILQAKRETLEVALAKSREQVKRVIASWVEDAAERIASAETREIQKVIAKSEEDREKFNKWVTKFFSEQASYIKQTLSPIESAWRYVTEEEFYVRQITGKLSREGVQAFTQEDLSQLMPIWKEKRIEDITSLINGGMENA